MHWTNIGYIVLAYFILLRKYLVSSDFTRVQLKYALLGTVITAVLGSTYGLLIPLFLGNDGSYPWIGPYSALALVVVFTYFGFLYRVRGIAT